MAPRHQLIIFLGEGNTEFEAVIRPEDVSDEAYLNEAEQSRVRRLIELGAKGVEANIHVISCDDPTTAEFQEQIALAEQFEAAGVELPTTQEVLMDFV